MPPGSFRSCAVLGILALNTITDLRKREILPLTTLLSAAASMLWLIFVEEQPVWQVLAGAVPGLFLLAAALVSEGRIGGGDGLVLLAMGIWLGLFPAMIIGILAGILALFRSVFLRSEIPFVPYLLAGYLLWMILAAS